MLVVKSRLRAWCRSVMVVVLTALEVKVYLSSCRSLWRRRPWVTAAVFSNARCCWSGPLSSYPQDDSLARRRCSVGRRRWRKLGNRLLPGGCKQRHDLTPVRGVVEGSVGGTIQTVYHGFFPGRENGRSRWLWQTFPSQTARESLLPRGDGWCTRVRTTKSDDHALWVYSWWPAATRQRIYPGDRRRLISSTDDTEQVLLFVCLQLWCSHAHCETANVGLFSPHFHKPPNGSWSRLVTAKVKNSQHQDSQPIPITPFTSRLTNIFLPIVAALDLLTIFSAYSNYFD